MDATANPVHGLFAPPPAGTAVRRPFAPVPDDARPYAVPMRDGVLLATDVYLPSHGSRWPVLLSRVPYDKASDECHMPANARWFAERGYAVVVQDVRGKIRSGGELAPFRHEVLDGYDTIEWITEQPWCGGPVGMFGDSYFGWTQWAAAASQHPALRAITPRVISADIADITARQGVATLEVTSLWALETWVDETLYGYEGQLDWSVRPFSEVVPTALGGRRSEFLDDAATGRLPDTSRLSVRGDLPALHTGGWWDIQHGQIATWREALGQWRAPQYLVMDARDHGWTGLRTGGESYVDPRTDDSTMQAFLDGYLGSLLPFLDHHVAGKGSYDQPPVRWMLAGDSWREGAGWPPAGSRPMDWFPSGTGVRGGLAARPDRRECPVAWTHDPHDPVPSLAHAYHPLVEPADESALDPRDDVLVYQTEPLRAPLDLAGPASVSVSLTSSGASANLMATLSDVAPDGSALKILDGVGRFRAPWPVDAVVDLGSTGYRLLPGHRLRIALSASQFPRYAVDPGTGADAWTATDFRRTEQQIVLGGSRAARLRCFALETSGESA